VRPSRQLGQEKDGRAAAYPGHDHGDVAHEKGQPRRVALLAILTANGARPPLRPHPECRGTPGSDTGVNRDWPLVKAAARPPDLTAAVQGTAGHFAQGSGTTTLSVRADKPCCLAKVAR
jgi:hypothetical protein